jgi:3-methylcrotonyl-CoA carboxylase alpha subunit
MFKKILIANRGEIAVRVAQTVQEMGILAATVYSDPDRSAQHVLAVDEAYALEGKTAAETYLRGEKIIAIARGKQVDAIHPGYGFLSENAGFAQACGNAGITFIGPSPEVIRATGNKIAAKKTLAAAGVPVVPGWTGTGKEDSARFQAEASRIGYPLLIKAASGGGGKGMRLVREERELLHAVESAQREAGAAFGDSEVFLEKFLERPRHVEFQIFGDSHGNVVHLFERECSIQRRHQKILEETPSPALNPQLRARMGEAAVRAARAVHYTNAGTVEFLVDSNGEFYFLEINTRLQVEHPVTELTTGHDLVRAQILVAAGESLPFSQETLRQDGHAIEVRICAEDASRDFMPSTGTIAVFEPPVGPSIRVDSGVVKNSEVSVYYDPMLAKLIVKGRDRNEAMEKLSWALSRFAVLGVTTNISFLRALIAHPEFRAGKLHTQFLQEHSIAAQNRGASREAIVAAALAIQQVPRSDTGRTTNNNGHREMLAGPWQAGGWRSA